MDFAESAAYEPTMALQMWLGTQVPPFQAFPSPRQSGGSKGYLRRLHFMRTFAPYFGRLVAGAQVYPVRRCEQGVHDRGGGVPYPLSCDVNQPSTRVSNS